MMYFRRIAKTGLPRLHPFRSQVSCGCQKTYITVTVNSPSSATGQYHHDTYNFHYNSNLFNREFGRQLFPTCLQTVPLRKLSRQSFAEYLTIDSTPIYLAYQTLNYVHDMSGLPWWGSIALTTFVLRGLITLPLAVYSSRILAKVECLQPEIAELAKELKGEVAMATKKYQWTYRVAKHQFTINLKRHIRELYIRDNCHPFKASVVVWVQMPLWICLSLALRNMAGALPLLGQNSAPLTPDLETQGILWFSNMLVPDPTLVLPVLVALLNLANVELTSLRIQNPSRFSRMITNVLRGVSLLMIPIGASVPSCMCLYWACSSLFSFGQNIILKVPSIRRRLPVPRTPNESDTPFMDMYRIAKVKYSWKKREK